MDSVVFPAILIFLAINFDCTSSHWVIPLDGSWSHQCYFLCCSHIDGLDKKFNAYVANLQERIDELYSSLDHDFAE